MRRKREIDYPRLDFRALNVEQRDAVLRLAMHRAKEERDAFLRGAVNGLIPCVRRLGASLRAGAPATTRAQAFTPRR